MDCFLVCFSRSLWPANVYRIEVTNDPRELREKINNSDIAIDPVRIEYSFQVLGSFENARAAIGSTLRPYQYNYLDGYYRAPLETIMKKLDVIPSVNEERDDKKLDRAEGEPLPEYVQPPPNGAPHVPFVPVPIVPRTTENEISESKRGPKHVSMLFADGDRVKHYIKSVNSLWIGVYSSKRLAIVREDREWTTIGGFVSAHHAAVDSKQIGKPQDKCLYIRAGADESTWRRCSTLKSPYEFANDI